MANKIIDWFTKGKVIFVAIAGVITLMLHQLSRKLIVLATPATCAPRSAGCRAGRAGHRKATAPPDADMPSDRKRLAARVIASRRSWCVSVTAL